MDTGQFLLMTVECSPVPFKIGVGAGSEWDTVLSSGPPSFLLLDLHVAPERVKTI